MGNRECINRPERSGVTGSAVFDRNKMGVDVLPPNGPGNVAGEVIFHAMQRMRSMDQIAPEVGDMESRSFQ